MYLFITYTFVILETGLEYYNHVLQFGKISVVMIY